VQLLKTRNFRVKGNLQDPSKYMSHYQSPEIQGKLLARQSCSMMIRDASWKAWGIEEWGGESVAR
jgi:hypothetical protein